MSGQVLAAIDVGSNTILLLVARYDPRSGLTIIDEAEDQPRLGAGLGATGRLSAEAMTRALASLASMLERCRRHGVTRMAAVATAAMREAKNGDEFVQRVRELGIPLRVIPPEEEAALAYRSAAYHFPDAGRLLIADIGGGSLELVGAEEGRIELTDSLPLGAVRLTELRLPLTSLRDHVRESLSSGLADNRWSGARLIGSGGTFATLARIVNARRGTPDAAVHGTEVSRLDLERVLNELAGLTADQRRKVPGLKPERADIIVAGLAAVLELLLAVNAGSVTVSGFGIREGMLLGLVEATPHTESRYS